MNYSYGSLKFDIPLVTLQNLAEQGFMISEVAKMLVISERPFYRIMAQFSLSKYNFSSVCDEDLDFTLSEVAKDYTVAMITQKSPQLKSSVLKTL